MNLYLLAATTYLPVEIHVGEFVTQTLEVIWLHAGSVSQDVVVGGSNSTLANWLRNEEEVVPATTAYISASAMLLEREKRILGMGDRIQSGFQA